MVSAGIHKTLGTQPVRKSMEWFVLALQGQLSRPQRAFLEEALKQVVEAYLDDLDDPEFRQWIAQSQA